MQALLWKALPNGQVQCRLCCHFCKLGEGEKGLCGMRKNVLGSLQTLAAHNVVTAHCDPIEKKPLYHFLPGSDIFSLATAGCNFSCTFCQNAGISRKPAEGGTVESFESSPALIVKAAQEARAKSIAFTYTEPTIFYELMLECAQKALSAGLQTVMVSNGFQSPQALATLTPFIRAANIDLKSFNDDFYRNYCGARLDPVLDNLQALHEAGVWLEITTLLIPGLNDSDDELHALAAFIHSLDASVPWHISRFHPAYRMRDREITPLESMERAWRIGKEEGLDFVYLGNLSDNTREQSTFCPQCGALFIERKGFMITRASKQEECPQCGAAIAGVWK